MRTYLKFNEIAQIVRRNQLLDQTMRASVFADVAQVKPLFFMPNTIMDTTERMPGTNTDVYKVYIFGVLADGSKTLICLNGVDVYFDVRVEDCEIAESLLDDLKAAFVRLRKNFKSAEIVKGYRQDEFRIEPSSWVRFHFDNLRERSDCLKLVQGMTRPGFTGTPDGWKEKRRTASDDNGYNNGFYYHAIARMFRFNTAGWNYVTGYKQRTTENFPNISYAFSVDVANYVAADNIINDLESKSMLPFWVNRDPLIVATYDIETYTFKDANGEAPKPDDQNWNIFMLCLTIHYVYSKEPLARIVLVDVPIENSDWVFSDPTDKHGQKSNDIIVECGTEVNLLKAFIEVLSAISPDITIAFNNGSFDNPLIREKLKRFNLLTEFRDKISCVVRPQYERNREVSIDPVTRKQIPNNDAVKANSERIFKYSWATENVKISAEENLEVLRMDLPGMLDTDTMPVFKQMYPRNEVGRKFGLNFFLGLNKLSSKYDLPYKTMFKYYKAAIDYDATILQNITAETEAAIINACVAAGLTPDQIVEAIHTALGPKSQTKLNKYKMTDSYITGRSSIDRNMAEVAKYCLIDAYSCQLLYVQRVIVTDKREVANGSYVTLFAGFYRANGMKVRNLAGSEYYHNKSMKYPFMFSNAHPSNKKIKYPGAWVFPPRKGLNNRRPVTGLDFASLYPSLMMAYDLSPEKSIELKGTNPDPNAQQTIDKLHNLGYITHKIEFVAEVTDENASDLGAKVPVEGWTIRHSNVQKPGDVVDFVIEGVPCPRQGQQPLVGECMGVFPTILIRLFNQRRVLKKRFVAIGHLIEHMENIEAAHVKAQTPITWSGVDNKMLAAASITQEYITKVNSEANDPTAIISDLKFTHNKLDSKQRAIKVFMNTFYGEQGNYMSSIYKLLVAGAITSAGQENIKRVYNRLIEMSFDPIYGDTDSCYNSPPEKLFTELDEIYNELIGQINRSADYTIIDRETIDSTNEMFAQIVATYHKGYKYTESRYKAKDITQQEFNALIHHAFRVTLLTIVEMARNLSPDEQKVVSYIMRELYWTMMVQMTRRETTALTTTINKFLRDNNGTGYLTMDYEEVLFPVMFTGKKKYFGFAHLGEENFHPKDKDIFIKGIDIVKQGQSELARNIGMEIIREICDVTNDRDVSEIVKSKIRRIYATQWDLKHFIMTAKYKPAKQNIPILSFVDRMREQYTKYMEPGTPWYNPERAALFSPPEPGDSFKYVVVKRSQMYDLRGRKINLKKGDVMEYVSVYEASRARGDSSLEIDLNYYMEGAIMGLFSRFIVYMQEFKPQLNQPPLDDDAIDEYSLKLARKYIENYCNECAGIDLAQLRVTGRTYQKLTRSVESAIITALVNTIGFEAMSVLYRFGIPELTLADTKSTFYNNKVLAECINRAATTVTAYADNLVIAQPDPTPYITTLERMIAVDPCAIHDFISMFKVKLIEDVIDPETIMGMIANDIDICNVRIKSQCEDVISVMLKHKYKVTDVINDARVDALADDAINDDTDIDTPDFDLAARIDDIVNDFTLTDLEILKKFYDEVMMLAGIKEYHHTVVAIYRKLMELKNH